METQTLDAQNNLKKKNMADGITFPDFQINKVTVLETTRYNIKTHIQTDGENSRSEINPCI